MLLVLLFCFVFSFTDKCFHGRRLMTAAQENSGAFPFFSSCISSHFRRLATIPLYVCKRILSGKKTRHKKTLRT
jgi:hypothetical protein